MLEEHNYKTMDRGFPFLAGLVDRCSGCKKESVLTKIYVLYFQLMLSMTTDKCHWRERQVMKLEFGIDHFKNSILRTFRDHCPFGLYALNLIYWITL